jgi:transcriptional regulator with XRE-family HTH domain
MLETLNERLLYLRKMNNHSQKFVADFNNVSQSNYSKYEKGQVDPSLSFIVKILKFYSIDPNWLLFGEGEIFKVGYWTDYGSRLKIIRNHYELKQSEFAERLCVSRTKLSNYENNHLAPFDFLIRLCLSFKVNLNWLFANEGEKIFPLFSGINNQIFDVTNDSVNELIEGIKPRFYKFLNTISYDVNRMAQHIDRSEHELDNLWNLSRYPDYKAIWTIVDGHNLNLNWLLANIGSMLFAKEMSFYFDEKNTKIISLDPMDLMTRIDKLEKELEELKKK